MPLAPTAEEDLSTKPAAQIAFREAYYTGYGPAPAINRTYERNAQRYRDLYYRLHAEVDGPINRVRRAVTEGGSANAVLVRAADHGDLLGAHGGLHQKWFNLYDEATRVPFVIARIGERPTKPRVVTAPTSHVDLVPTLLSAAGLDAAAVAAVAATLAESFSEVHELGISLITFGGFSILQAIGIVHGLYQQDLSLILGMAASLLTCGTVTALTIFYRLRRLRAASGA